jgi:hypothetical protein
VGPVEEGVAGVAGEVAFGGDGAGGASLLAPPGITGGFESLMLGLVLPLPFPLPFFVDRARYCIVNNPSHPERVTRHHVLAAPVTGVDAGFAPTGQLPVRQESRSGDAA